MFIFPVQLETFSFGTSNNSAIDSVFEHKLEKQIKFMIDGDIHFSYTNYKVKNSNQVFSKLMKKRVISKKDMQRINSVGCLTVIYNRLEVGLIQIPNLKKRNDYALWLKILNSLIIVSLYSVCGVLMDTGIHKNETVIRQIKI